ncbi:MAG: RNA polymerase factor sigma-32 [Thermodesulfobacteriota bacterium]|nr:RNA polymerase factor sigma-32 [Thermodesulfobacteriota bacterium]
MGTDILETIEKEDIEVDYEEESKESSLVPFDPLQKYLAEIRRHPLLTPEEERRLTLQYRETGEREVAYRLITGNLRLVVQIALEFHKYWMMSLLDLIQEGNIGLMQAVRKFDPYKGTKLSYYASFWIKAYILKFIIDNWRLVKIGTTQSQRKLFFNLEKEKRRLEALGYDPTPKLLAERLDTKEKDVIEMDQRLGGWEVSLDRPVSDESDGTYKDLLPAHDIPHDEMMIESETKNILLKKLEEFHETLKDKELYIFEKRLLSDGPMTLQEIGDEYGISKERVRQIEKRLKGKIKRFLQERIPEMDIDDDLTIDIDDSS